MTSPLPQEVQDYLDGRVPGWSGKEVENQMFYALALLSYDVHQLVVRHNAPPIQIAEVDGIPKSGSVMVKPSPRVGVWNPKQKDWV